MNENEINKYEIIDSYHQYLIDKNIYKEWDKRSIDEFNINPKESIMIGDSKSDCESAKTNKVPFMLRRTKLNRELQAQLSCQMFDDFICE